MNDRSLVQGGNSPVRGQHKKRKPQGDISTMTAGASNSGLYRRNVVSSSSPGEASHSKNYEAAQLLESPIGSPQGIKNSNYSQIRISPAWFAEV